MARKYKRLNYEDRKAIEAMCKQGKRAEEIAEAMDVHRATIYHELKRGGAENGNRKQYSADISALYKKDEATKRQTQELLRNIIRQHWKGTGGIEKVLTGLD